VCCGCDTYGGDDTKRTRRVLWSSQHVDASVRTITLFTFRFGVQDIWVTGAHLDVAYKFVTH